MAEKAMVRQVYGLYSLDNQYHLEIDVACTDGSGWYVTFKATASASSLQPSAPAWRDIIRDAIIAKASADYNLTVDQVLFPDYGV
jgi:hypothetical protein